MMKKIAQIIFIEIIFLLLLFPIAKFNKEGVTSETENRTLAKKPTFSFNKLASYDAYFQDRFGGRDTLINIANFIDYKIFNKQIRNSKALKGKNNWYYYIEGGNLNDYNKTNLLTKSELENQKAIIKNRIEWCNKNKIKYLFVICPNKHSVYPENYIFERPDGITRTDQIINIFNELNVNYVFPRDYFIEIKDTENYPLYYETDTHWNDLGAFYAFKKIENKIKQFFPQTTFPNIQYKIEATSSNTVGDILPMLGIKNAKSTLIFVTPKNGNFSDYFEYIKNAKGDGVFTKSKYSTLPTAIVYRDSFFNALTPFFSSQFSNVEYVWKKFEEKDKEYILKNKPDIIVFEYVERYTGSL